MIEDKIPDLYKKGTYHPSAFVYAWKRKNLEKLFEELMQSNIAIKRGEVWLVDEENVLRTIPLKGGGIKIFNWEVVRENDDWYDFVERSIKEAIDLINFWDIEKNVRIDKEHSLWYHFEFEED